MANLNFPSNPNVGDVYTVNGKTWEWNGVAWTIQRQGISGKSAYEIAIQNGFVGTEAQWLASLVGQPGSTGPQGPKGDQGDRGVKGDTGDTGANGTNGTNGQNALNGIPNGGGQGQVLTKNSNNPYDASWQTPDYYSDYTVPLGGNQGQYLGKSSAGDGDFHWMDLPNTGTAPNDVPLGGNEGQVLTKNSASDRDYAWKNVPNTTGVPVGGLTSQVLTKNSNFDGDASWISPQVGVPEAPTDGQLYARSQDAWIAFDPGSSTGGSGGSSEATNVTPTDTGPSGALTSIPAHKYWRIYNLTEDGSENYISFSNVEFRTVVGTAKQATGGNAIASGNYGTNYITYAFDGNDSTTWISDNNLPNWIGYSFPDPIGVAEVLLRNRADGYTYQAPHSFTVQYSDDGTVWNDAWQESDISWNNTLQAKLFQNPNAANTVTQYYPTKIAALNDVANTVPTEGQVLTWDSSTNQYKPKNGATYLGGLTDVDLASHTPTDGQALVFDSATSKWSPGSVAGGSGGGFASDMGDLHTALAAKFAHSAVTQNGELATGSQLDAVVDKGGLVGFGLYANTINGYNTRNTGSAYTVPDGCVAICFGGKCDDALRNNSGYYAGRLYNVTQAKIVGTFIISGSADRIMAQNWGIQWSGLMSCSAGGGAATFDFPIAGVAGDVIQAEAWTAGDGNYRFCNAEYYVMIVDATTGQQIDVTGQTNSNDYPAFTGKHGQALVVDPTESHVQWNPIVTEAPSDNKVYARSNDSWVVIENGDPNNSDLVTYVPQLVQAGHARGNGGATVTLANQPAVGNSILMVLSSYSSAKTFPTGFSYLTGGNWASNQCVWFYIKTVTASDGKSYSVSGSDNNNLSVYEIQGVPNFMNTFSGSPGFIGNNWDIPIYQAPFGDSLTFVALEHDLNVPFMINANNRTIDSKIFTDANNHQGLSAVISQNSLTHLGGTVSSTNSPLYVVVQFGLGIKKSDAVDLSQTTASAQTQIPYRFGGWMTAGPQTNETLMMHVVTDAFTIPANLTGAVGYCGTAPVSTFTLSLQKNNVEFGQMKVAADKSITFTGTATQFAVGDLITCVSTTADAAIANLAWTFKGVTV